MKKGQLETMLQGAVDGDSQERGGLGHLATEQRLLLCNYRAGSTLGTGSSGKLGELKRALSKGIAQVHWDVPCNG